ncbi:MAG TPA: transcriptional regulator, partial [Ktedonobacteraceae bacterium]|nr:transcriptional regulator [Ktedonobacteraceae bacterium]
MPRYAHYQLKWSSQTQTYALYIGGSASEVGFSADSLEKIASFSFQSRSGEYCTVRKQTVQRGTEYWYGYRRVQGRIVKRYLGRTADLSIARLEEVARLLGSKSASSPHRSQPNEETDVSHTVPSSPRSSSGGEQGSEAALPLISSKLSPPRLPDLLVERSHLLARLDSCLSRSLMLLQAPAGFGKTTLVTQWIVQRRIQCSFPVVAWVSLEAFDNDPLRFWRSIIAACQTFQDNIGQTALALLSSRSLPPFEMPPLEMVLTHLLNDISHQMQSALLVLDDYHVIEEPQIHQAMAFFIDHLPTTLRVLLLSRSQPPLPLLRWRARGDLSELHLADLRFSLQETTAFLHQALPAPLSDAVLMRVDTSLEGWAAGLRLLSLTLQGRRTAQEVEHALLSLGDTSGSSHAQQPLLDYFVTEILQAQPEPLQRFLLQASVLSRLNGILCDAVIGTEDTAALLETVERAGLFLEALDGVGRWYRLHSLFTEALRREANRCLGEAVLHALAQRASQWYEDHALYEEAIEAALQARDMERVALLIEQADMDGPHHELQTLHRWLSQLPETVLCAHPMLCWLTALTLRFLQAETA